MRTKPVFANCAFGFGYLLLRGKAHKLVLMSGSSPILPLHIGALTRSGHFLHFYRNKPHSENHYGPWWFDGSFRGSRQSLWREVMVRAGHAKWILVLPSIAGMLLCTIGYILLFVLWVGAWALFGPIWTLKWSIHGLLHR